MKRPSWRRIEEVAARHFGISDFRPGRREVIRLVLQGKDVLAIMPTGAGKSLCYQLPALFLPKRTVVVSPLISLMQDQQEKLEAADVDAVKLDSTLTQRRTRETLEELEEGAHRIVYLTPERLEHPEAIDLLRQEGVSLLVVDEAHCVSQWGHDFRPAYLGLRDAIAALGHPPVLAVTATATAEAAADIRTQLRIETAVTINTGTERPNLFLEVFRTTSGTAKRKKLLEYLRREPGVGIVYVATVRACEELHEWLLDSGVKAGCYHGKRTTHEREDAQVRFMRDEYKVMVATNAFGLGIDKPDIRFVVHYHFPDSLEMYYQEAGRAGRDGKRAKASLFYRLEDRRIQAYFLGGKYPRREESQRIYETMVVQMEKTSKPVGLRALTAATGLGERRCKVVLAQLEGAGILARTPRGAKLLRKFAAPADLEAFLSAYEKRHTSDRKRLHEMMRYAESTSCRMQYILSYFGEELVADCQHCDNCLARAAGKFEVPREARHAEPPRLEASRFHAGDHVEHPDFGSGVVVESHEGKAVVAFAQANQRLVLETFLRPATASG